MDKYNENEVITLNADDLNKATDVESYIKGSIAGKDDAVSNGKISWKQKLSSRKLWAAVVGVVVGLAAAFGLPENEYSQIAGIVTSAVSVLAYIFGEASVDKARKSEDGKSE